MRERAATAADYPLFVQAQGWLGLTFAPLPEERWREHILPTTFFLETDDGELAGYASCRPFGARGDVRQIAVAPAHRRRGVGRALMRRVAERLRAAGCKEWRLEVQAGNRAAIALYEAVGMRAIGEQTTFRLSATELQALVAGAAFVEEELSPVSADDVTAVEARFDLPPGKLARMEAVRPGGAVWVIERDGRLEGLARFHPELAPDLGIVFPLRAAGVADAQALLAACLRGAAVPPLVELCVEAAPLRAWLVAAGHAPADELLVMGGPIPP
jgi:ribosomal protein S18 acetylase RimI-like enzyme